MSWKDKVVLVTGGASGIGRAIAEGFAADKASVVICDVSQEAGETIARHLGPDASFFQVDIRYQQVVQAWVDKVIERYSKVDILVNNAGVNIPRPATDITPEQWNTVLDTNLKGTFFCSQAVAKYMIPRRQGKIINMSSAAGAVATPERAHYGSSKAGINMLTRNLAYEWAQYNINVNAVAPTFVETELAAATLNRPEMRESFLARIPLGRFCTLEDVVAAVLFLASSKSDFITGTVLPVDGGLHIL